MNGYLTDPTGSLFDELRRWERRLDDLFSAQSWPAGIRSTAAGAFPPMNVGCNPQSVDVYLFAAGLDPASIELSIQQNLLSVSGERTADEEQEGDAHHYRRERFSGRFQRSVTLPEDVDPDQVEARYRDGVLHVSVRRREPVTPRQIEIH